MSADGGEKCEPLAKWAFRGACPSSFHKVEKEHNKMKANIRSGDKTVSFLLAAGRGPQLDAAVDALAKEAAARKAAPPPPLNYAR